LSQGLVAEEQNRPLLESVDECVAILLRQRTCQVHAFDVHTDRRSDVLECRHRPPALDGLHGGQMVVRVRVQVQVPCVSGGAGTWTHPAHAVPIT
jgi:hypothetical protein